MHLNENYVCGEKNMPDYGGNRICDHWNASLMLYQFRFEVMFRNWFLESFSSDINSTISRVIITITA